MNKAGVSVSHIGICVSDAERSKRFYIEALGFEPTQYVDFAEPYDILTELPGLKAHAALLALGNFVIEIISYDSPEVVGPATRRPMNQLGFTHLSVIVDDLEAVAERIERFGGHAIRSTLVGSQADDTEYTIVYTTDPDGTRIELMQSKQAQPS